MDSRPISLAEILKDFESECGQIALEPGGFIPPLKPGYPSSVSNQNGILFRFETVLQAKLNGYDIKPLKEMSMQAIRYTQVNMSRTNRRPGEDGSHGKDAEQSHDNKLGELGLMQIHEEWNMIQTFKKHLAFNLWSYNNIKPYQWRLKTWLLPREQALYRLACGEFPGLVSFIWLWFSIHTKSAHKRLNRLRMESLRMSYNKHGGFFCKLLLRRYEKWWNSWGGMARFKEEVPKYYKHPLQPYRRLIEAS